MLNDFLESISLDDITNGKIILVDKPIKWTSFDVVKYIRKSLQIRLKHKKIKVGHAGTLEMRQKIFINIKICQKNTLV